MTDRVKPAPARPRGVQARAPIGVRCPVGGLLSFEAMNIEALCAAPV